MAKKVVEVSFEDSRRTETFRNLPINGVHRIYLQYDSMMKEQCRQMTADQSSVMKNGFCMLDFVGGRNWHKRGEKFACAPWSKSRPCHVSSHTVVAENRSGKQTSD